ALGLVWSPVTHDPIDAPVFQALADTCRVVTRIQAHTPDIEAKSLTLSIEPVEVGAAVVQVGRRGVAVGDDGVAAIDGAVIKVEEALGLAFPNHIATVRIGTADLGVFGLGWLLG